MRETGRLQPLRGLELVVRRPQRLGRSEYPGPSPGERANLLEPQFDPVQRVEHIEAGQHHVTGLDLDHRLVRREDPGLDPGRLPRASELVVGRSATMGDDGYGIGHGDLAAGAAYANETTNRTASAVATSHENLRIVFPPSARRRACSSPSGSRRWNTAAAWKSLNRRVANYRAHWAALLE